MAEISQVQIPSGDIYDVTAKKFDSARTIALTGAVTGSVSSDGENGWSIPTTYGSTVPVNKGGTGATTLTEGQALIGNGTDAVTTRAIKNNTNIGHLGWTSDANGTVLITENTLAYWNGAYSGTRSNIDYVRLGKLGTIVTHNEADFLSTSGGIVDGSVTITDLTVGNLVVNGAGRFVNGLYGTLTGNVVGNISGTAKTITDTLPITKGGTGATTAADARTNLGLGTAATLDITTSQSDTWNKVMHVRPNGVMEVGKSIDFHAVEGENKDFNARLDAWSDDSLYVTTKQLVISRSTSIADNFPAKLLFRNIQSDNNIISANSYIAVYDDHDDNSNNQNMIIQSSGPLIMGVGESPSALYDALKPLLYKHLYLTADSNIYIEAGGNTIANRKGMVITSELEVIPVAAEVLGTVGNPLGTIGTAGHPWANIHAINFHGTLDGTTTYTNLIKPISGTTTTSASTWNIPNGSFQVWGQRFSDSRLKYTPSGGSETTITDPGDIVLFLTPNPTQNLASLNMRIDGSYYGSFVGNVSGNASTATKATQDSDGKQINTTYLKLAGGTLTGALNLANNTLNKIGDDVMIGDVNLVGTLGIKGINNKTSILLIPNGATDNQSGVKWTANSATDSTITGTLNGNFKGNLTGTASGNLSLSGGIVDGSVHITDLTVGNLIVNGAGRFLNGIYDGYSSDPQLHNRYRGKNLGTSFTSAQATAISSGTFDNLYVGDYWTINGIVYRIAGIDPVYNRGDAAITKHHLVIVPDSQMYAHQMSKTDSGGYEDGSVNTTAGGYASSYGRTTGLTSARTTIIGAFGDSHVLSYRDYLTNTVTNGVASAGAWTDCRIELMSEMMVYGACIRCVPSTQEVGIFTFQLPLFSQAPYFINNKRQHLWLRSVASALYFCNLNVGGFATAGYASHALGIRPFFLLG